MAAQSSYVAHLSAIPLFSGCTTKELRLIAKASEEVKIAKGTVLVDQGQAGKEAFIVLDGEANVSRNGRKVATVGAGAIIGELALLDRGPRTATVTAITDMTVLILEQRNFAGILDAVPALSHKLLAALASRIRDLDRQTFG